MLVLPVWLSLEQPSKHKLLSNRQEYLKSISSSRILIGIKLER